MTQAMSRPGTPTVAYDADCELCVGFRSWVENEPAEGSPKFVPIDSWGEPEGRATNGLAFVDSAGRTTIGTQAVLFTIATRGGVIGLIANILGNTPFYLAFVPAYRLFAAHRRQLGRIVRSLKGLI